MSVVGATLVVLALAPAYTSTARAIPPAALTPTAEPATRTPPPQPTDTPQPIDTPQPTDIPQPTDTPQPTVKAKPERADPAVTKAASVAEARIGDIVDFTLTVTNHGGETADDVVVTDALPDFLDVVEANSEKGTVAVDGRVVVVTIGPVRPNEVIVIRIRTRVNDRAQPPGGRNSVALTSSNNSDDPDNNVDEVSIAILPAGDQTATPLPTAEAWAVAPPSASPLVVAGPPPAALPVTGAADAAAGSTWPLALLGLAAIGFSLVLRRHGAGRESRGDER
jgi:uncharacterized repeat protein (TIGR01451 family)